MEACAAEASVLVIATPWKEFKALRPEHMQRSGAASGVYGLVGDAAESGFRARRRLFRVRARTAPAEPAAKRRRSRRQSLVCRQRRSHILKPRVLVTGAGGFIGHHLVNYLEGARLLGARRRPEASRIRADGRGRIRDCSTCAAGKTACRPRGASTKCTRWPRTWAAWDSSARIMP